MFIAWTKKVVDGIFAAGASFFFEELLNTFDSMFMFGSVQCRQERFCISCFNITQYDNNSFIMNSNASFSSLKAMILARLKRNTFNSDINEIKSRTFFTHKHSSTSNDATFSLFFFWWGERAMGVFTLCECIWFRCDKAKHRISKATNNESNYRVQAI